MVQGKSLVRKVTDLKNRASGKQPYRVIFKLQPTHLDKIPESVGQIVFIWQRGAKLQITKVYQVVNGAAVFEDGDVLQQSTTMYKEGDKWLAKEYKLKLESVTQKNGADKTKTLSRFNIDFAVFGALVASGETEDIEVNLKPCGVLRAKVSVVWLKNFDHNNDASEASFATGLQSVASFAPDRQVDQDLEGFDQAPVGSHSSPGGRGSRGSTLAARQKTILEGEEEGGGSGRDHSAGPSSAGASPLARSASLGASQVPLPLPLPPTAAKGKKSWLPFSSSTNSRGHHSASASPRGTDSRFRLVDTVSDMQYIDAATELEALRSKAKDLVYQRDRLHQRGNEASSSGADAPPEFVDQLVQAKLMLAQSEYRVLELVQMLSRERQRTAALMAKATNLTAQRDLLMSSNSPR